MSALLVPCTYTARPTPAVWREGLILHSEYIGLHRDTFRIVVADAETGELVECTRKDVLVHTGAQAEEHH